MPVLPRPLAGIDGLGFGLGFRVQGKCQKVPGSYNQDYSAWGLYTMTSAIIWLAGVVRISPKP